MREQSFYDWLMNEVASSRRALIGLYEQRDKLLYIEAPPLRKRYMETIGVYEEDVLQAELDVAMLRRKAEMIQILVNQRLPVDLRDIDAAIEAEREQTVSELEASDRTLYEFPQLSEQEKHTLQSSIGRSQRPSIRRSILTSRRRRRICMKKHRRPTGCRI